LDGFRHSIKYIIKHRIISRYPHISLDDDDSEGSESDEGENLLEDDQAGHSTHWAQLVYSRNQYMPSNVTENRYNNYLNLCKKVHAYFNLDNKSAIVRSSKHSRGLSDLNNEIYSKRIKSTHNLFERFQNQVRQNAYIDYSAENLENHLVNFFKNKKAKFKSAEQLQGLQAWVNNSGSII
jgi:hypothetical protein